MSTSTGWLRTCLAVVLAAALTSTACGPAERSDQAGVVDDGWSVGPPRVSLAQGPGTDFFDVSGAVRLSDGRLVVADGGSSEVRYFDPDGRHLSSVGGRGEGPGEFALIQSMGPAGGDSVWVYDYGTQRITILAPDGATARTARVTPALSAGVMVGRRSDGSFVLAQMWGSPDPSAPVSEGLVREPAAVAAYDGEGRLLDTLARVPGREVLQHLEGGRMVMGAVPLGRTASQALVDDVLVLGDQVDRVLRLFGTDGGPRGELRWDGPPLELERADVEAWREARLVAVPEAERASMRAQLAETPLPDRRPAYDQLLGDAEGCVWVAAYALPGGPAPRWQVLDQGGGLRASLTLPGVFRPLQIGPDWVLGVARDRLDVERVELRPLLRGADPGC